MRGRELKIKMHRNSQKRHHQENKTYFITCSVKDKKDFFKESLFCELFVEELRLVKQLKQFELHAFGLNYNHFHLLIMSSQEFDISKIMQSLRRHFIRNVNIVMGFNEQNIPPESAIGQSRFHGEALFLKTNNVSEIPKAHNSRESKEIIKAFDLHSLKLKNKFTQKYGANQDVPKFQWQKSFHDHVIRNEKDFKRHHYYTQYNFLKHGLPKNWRYTSLNYADMIGLEIIW